MPGWYIHLEVARKLAKDLPGLAPGDANVFAEPGPTPQDLARIIEQYPNYYALGALGPDIFFFLPDFKGHIGNMIAEAATWMIKAYNVIDKNIIGPWEDKFAPISEDANELVSRLTGGLSDELGRLCQYASGVITELILDLISVAFPDWFGLLGCGPGGAFDDSLFMWSDMFHYRRTNEFACDLYQHARDYTYDAQGNTGPAAKGHAGYEPGYGPGVAFALGWMTHIGTDVTGHAFVNEKVGGPFRLHRTAAAQAQASRLRDLDETRRLAYAILNARRSRDGTALPSHNRNRPKVLGSASRRLGLTLPAPVPIGPHSPIADAAWCPWPRAGGQQTALRRFGG